MPTRRRVLLLPCRFPTLYRRQVAETERVGNLTRSTHAAFSAPSSARPTIQPVSATNLLSTRRCADSGNGVQAFQLATSFSAFQEHSLVRTHPCLVVCALDGSCYIRDGTLQPKVTAFDRVVTNPDGTDYAPSAECMLVLDDGTVPLYVQTSGSQSGPPAGAELKTYINDVAAIADGLPYGNSYSLTTGYTVQLKRPEQ